MKAYYVHKSQGDWIVIPQTRQKVRVNQKVFEAFLSEPPDFGNWNGEPTPEMVDSLEIICRTLGPVIAYREDRHPPIPVDRRIWVARQEHFGIIWTKDEENGTDYCGMMY
ncbi:MAG: hypothetical protein GWM98_28345 [Nitrospinaceae bacterium]|nr:hypothetical protein [Nitrospinaceae bacterium]NIR57645.1 hypothetical protein [Nitrospinaceae bacterium]NIS88119.1 hypothetical protein [Nitrospinaceae bacterium]NIT84986.1 hypothetical protein [Nitrospinaceae bacterium]NIU47155.1 hypothetical protein [Nitrospinaceae bacterium]